MSDSARQRVQKLREQIEYHNRLYHSLDEPEITDADFDALMRDLQALEAAHPELATPDSPTRRVGAVPSSKFAEVRHAVPMLSPSNAFSEQEVRDFVRRIEEKLDVASPQFSAELKLDGLAISLRYVQGCSQGATLGDGATGEDVTANLRTLKNIPRSILPVQWLACCA